MTTIIAHSDGWMVADTLTVWGEEQFPFTQSKVLRHSGHLIGLAGATDKAYNGIVSMPEGEHITHQNFAKIIGLTPEESVIALIISPDTRYDGGFAVYQVSCDGGVYHPPCYGSFYSAIGSGRKSAMGFLNGYQTATADNHKRHSSLSLPANSQLFSAVSPITQRLAQEAIICASTMEVTTSAESEIFQLKL